jgi:Undecaprenyl-phosphate galactose phosphotransferase WbaP
MTTLPAPTHLPPPPLLRRGLAFVAGVGFAFVPAFGPFLALLVMVTGRVELQRADRWWWTAAALLGLPWLLAGPAAAGALAVAQGLAVWLIYRSASAVRSATGTLGVWREASVGVLFGLAGVLVRGLARTEDVDLTVQRSFAQALAWSEHPNLFAHTILVASLLVAILLPSPRLRLVALTIGAIGILAAGAREAAVAWVVVALILVLRDRTRGAVRTAAFTLVGLVLVVAAGVGPALGLGRTGFLVDLVAADGRTNLLRGTEIPRGDWWHELGVSFEHGRSVIAGEPLTVYTVTKHARDPWSRLQQVVPLTSGDYTLSAWLLPGPGTAAGLDGWGRSRGVDFNLAITLHDSGWTGTASGSIRLLDQRELARDGDWRHVAVSFHYAGEPTVWYVGVVPDRVPATGGTSSFAALQLERELEASGYQAAPADRGLDLAAGRFPVWRDALQAAGERPLLGWGPQGLPTAVASTRAAAGPDADARNRPLAAHAHNAYLDVLVERGAMGLIGLLLLVAILSLRAVQQRDVTALAVLAAVISVNLFDTTLLYGGVLYPLAAVLGWRAAGARPVAYSASGLGSGLAVRLTLAGMDYLAALASIALAHGLMGWFGSSGGPWFGTAVLYVAFAWPAMAWREGSYPAYGRQPAEELRSSVSAAAYASLLVAFTTLVFGASLPLAPGAMLLTLVLSVVLMPLGRAIAKRALYAYRMWGRSVVMIGTGPEATALMRHLEARPLLGLHPLARFGHPDAADDGPVAGPIDDAWPYLDAHGVQHVILAAAEFEPATVSEVMERSHRELRYLQVLPDLHGLPATAVAAVPLGQSLTLQVRNELASVSNRTIKRTVDVVASSLLIVVLSPLLLAIWLLVRLDSRGPGFYRSPRLGQDGEPFACVKFRTMRVDAEERLEKLLATDPELELEYRSFHKLRSDPRVTRIGRYLRAASLDELPQLFNVLGGSMSLIGPRPYLLREREIMGRSATVILTARPGITGYWQTYGRNDVTFASRLEMESYYVRNWSLWWDLVILTETPTAVVRRRGR